MRAVWLVAMEQCIHSALLLLTEPTAVSNLVPLVVDAVSYALLHDRW